MRLAQNLYGSTTFKLTSLNLKVSIDWWLLTLQWCFCFPLRGKHHQHLHKKATNFILFWKASTSSSKRFLQSSLGNPLFFFSFCFVKLLCGVIELPMIMEWSQRVDDWSRSVFLTFSFCTSSYVVNLKDVVECVERLFWNLTGNRNVTFGGKIVIFSGTFHRLLKTSCCATRRRSRYSAKKIKRCSGMMFNFMNARY